MDKKFLIPVLLFSIVIISIAFFLVKGDTKQDYREKNEKIKLDFRITWERHSGRGDAIDTVITAFNEKNESIEVEMLGGDEDHGNIIDTLGSDDSPDIIVLPYRELKNDDTLKYLHSMENHLSQEKKNYYPEILKLGTDKNGNLFGIPWIGHSMCFIYNKNILDEFSINPDEIRSFDLLLNAVEKISRSGEYTGIGLVGAEHYDLSWMTTQFIHSFGGSLCADGEITINSTETEKALDFYINGLGKYAQQGWENDNGVDVMDKFSYGKMAFEIQGPWGITDIWKIGNPFEVGTFSFSQIGGYSETGPLMLCISSDEFAAKKDQILEFIKYMIGKDALEKVMLGEFSTKHQEYYPFRVPVRNDMENGTFFRTFPEFKAFTDGFEKPSIDTPSPEWCDVRDKVYIPLLHETIEGKYDIEEFLREVEIRGETILSAKK